MWWVFVHERLVEAALLVVGLLGLVVLLAGAVGMFVHRMREANRRIDAAIAEVSTPAPVFDRGRAVVPSSDEVLLDVAEVTGVVVRS